MDDKDQEYTGEDEKFLDSLCEVIIDDTFNSFLSRLIGKFIHATSLVRRENDLSEITQRYALDVAMEDTAQNLCSLLQILAVELVFRTPQVHQLEYKGGEILRKLFKVMEEEYIFKDKPGYQLLPAHYHKMMLERDRKSVV